jgi:hypothetical protein
MNTTVKGITGIRFRYEETVDCWTDYHTDEHVVGYYNVGDRMNAWGKTGAFRGGCGDFCSVPRSFGFRVWDRFRWRGRWSVGWIVGALEGAIVVGGLSAIGAGLYSLGIPKDSLLRYEVALKTGKFVLMAHGSKTALTDAQKILNHTKPETLEHHQQRLQPWRMTELTRTRRRDRLSRVTKHATKIFSIQKGDEVLISRIPSHGKDDPINGRSNP